MLGRGRNPHAALLTLPGVDIIVAQALLSSLGDITRFPDPDKAAAYLGLTPSTYQSGNHCYHGKITKQGASHTRWLLTELRSISATTPVRWASSSVVWRLGRTAM